MDSWKNAKTLWGKVAVVIYYTFSILIMLSCVWSFLSPLSQGSDCIMKWAGLESKRAQGTYKALLRNYNLFLLGFTLYAVNKGVTVHNMALVLSFWILNTVGWWTIIDAAQTCPSSAELYGCPALILIVCICAVLETRLRDRNSIAEREPLLT